MGTLRRKLKARQGEDWVSLSHAVAQDSVASNSHDPITAVANRTHLLLPKPLKHPNVVQTLTLCGKRDKQIKKSILHIVTLFERI